MNGKQFIRRARKWAKANNQPIVVDKSRGKGGHQKVTVGGNVTFVKTSEIGTGLLHDMLGQLGIPKEDF